MSLDAIMRTAVSGLMTHQAALRTTSNNIANVNTPGYVRQEVMLASQVVGTTGMGVDIAEIRRIVDRFLGREYIANTAGAAYYRSQADLHDRLQAVLGAPDSEFSLAGRVDAAFASLGALALDPTQTARRITALQDLQALATDVGRLAGEVQTLRGEADRRLGVDIDAVNGLLRKIHELNPLIAQQKTIGQDASALQEQRERAVDELAGYIDIRAVELSDHYVQISTVSGLALLDKSLRQLDYDAAGRADVASVFDRIAINKINDFTGAATATGETLYPHLRAGGLKGLIDMRDVELPKIAEMLGELSAGLIDGINGVHNGNSAVPPPHALTGRNVGALGTDPHGFTGEVTFAVLDANDAVSASVTIDFSNPALTTLDDVVTAVNTGLGGAGTMALANGVLSLTAAGAGAGVAVLQDPANPSSRGGRGFADFFGLNDLLRARGAAHFDTGLTGTDAHGFGTGGAVAFTLQGPGGELALSANLDFSTLGGTTIADVVADLNTSATGYGSFALDADGRLRFTPASAYRDYALHVTNDTTSRGATGVSFTDFFGFGDAARMEPALDMAVLSGILDDPDRLALAKLDPSGTPALTEGDNRGALALQALETASVGFGAAGDLNAMSVTLSTYAASLLGTVGAEASQASGLAEDRELLVSEIDSQRSAVSGVNLDEELSNMIVFQNAYNAAARLITTANEMYDALLAMTI